MLRAILLSLMIHAGLAAVVVLLFSLTPAPVTRVELDLSRVDLSFADEEDEAPPVRLQSAATDVPASKPRVEARPPEPLPKCPAPHPPEAAGADFPEPPRTVDPMTPPPREPVVEEQTKLVSSPAAPTAAPAAPRQARVDAPPRPERTIRPVYPDGARTRGEEGCATVALVVGEEGTVVEARIAVTSGFAELDAAALKAVRAARFTPARADGKPVVAPARIALQFTLR